MNVHHLMKLARVSSFKLPNYQHWETIFKYTYVNLRMSKLVENFHEVFFFEPEEGRISEWLVAF